MSSDSLGATASAADVTTVDSEAYEPYEPDYSEAFPPLAPGTGAGIDIPERPQHEGAPTPVVPNQWGEKKRMSVKSTTVTQVFCVPLEERRYREMTEQQFGEKAGGQQAKSCMDIMQRTNVSIEMSLAKDQSLTVVITGKIDNVMRARKMVVQQLQTQAKIKIFIPREHHRFILGTKGVKLKDLELATATKINIPRSDESSEEITIFGSKDGLEKAKHEIQCISDEQAKLATAKLPIPKIYHPFICGPGNQTTRALMEATKARIMVPPQSSNKDEIFISGEKEGVFHCKEQIMKIYEEKKKVPTATLR